MQQNGTFQNLTDYIINRHVNVHLYDVHVHVYEAHVFAYTSARKSIGCSP